MCIRDSGMDEGVDLGPLTTAKRLEEIEKLVETTKKEGAKVLMGGQRPSCLLYTSDAADE